MTVSAIRLSDISISFGTQSGSFLAVKDVAFEVPKGRFVVLIGPSGCGKSTVLRVIADLLQPSTGEVSVFGGDAGVARQARRISFVFQDATLLPWRNILDNVRLPLQVGGWTKLGRKYREPAEMLELVGLAGRETALPHQLSGGQRQRVAIARALVTQPDILLMDEPFGALDEITRDRLNDELLRIWRNTGTTIVFVTHSLSEAAFLGQTVVVMAAHPGRVTEIINLDANKPGNEIDRSSEEFFRITSDLRASLEGAERLAA